MLALNCGCVWPKHTETDTSTPTHVRVHARIHTLASTRARACTYAHTHTRTQTRTDTHVTCSHVCIHAHVHVYAYICAHPRTKMQTHTHMLADMHTHNRHHTPTRDPPCWLPMCVLDSCAVSVSMKKTSPWSCCGKEAGCCRREAVRGAIVFTGGVGMLPANPAGSL